LSPHASTQPSKRHPRPTTTTTRPVITRVLLPKNITLDRDDGEQIAYILGRLEKLLNLHDDPLAYQVAESLTTGVTTEWLSCWVSAIRSVLCRKLFPTSLATATTIAPKQSPFRP